MTDADDVDPNCPVCYGTNSVTRGQVGDLGDPDERVTCPRCSDWTPNSTPDNTSPETWHRILADEDGCDDRACLICHRPDPRDAEITRLRDKLAAARKAMARYADHDNWDDNRVDYIPPDNEDGPTGAIEALAAIDAPGDTR